MSDSSIKEKLSSLTKVTSECLERQRLCIEGRIYDPSWTDDHGRHNWWSRELIDSMFDSGYKQPVDCRTCDVLRRKMKGYRRQLMTPEEREEEDKLIQASIEAIKEFEQEMEQHIPSLKEEQT